MSKQIESYRQGDVPKAVIWLPISGYEGSYEISSDGQVRSLPRKHCPQARTLRPRYNKQGYITVALYGVNGPKQFFVHRLVCVAFNGAAPLDKQDVNHKNGIKSDNKAENLEWSNDSLNVAHAFRVLHVKHAITKPWLGKFGADNPSSKPVLQIHSDGKTLRFDGVSSAARSTGLSFKHISACCRGKRKRHGGFQWRFEETQMEKPYMARQGDVLLISTDIIPDDAVAVPRNPTKGVVLAWGEVTNHSHRFSSRDVQLFQTPTKERFLRVVKTSNLLHEEHTTHKIPPGVYKLPMQVGYTPSELIRVAD